MRPKYVATILRKELVESLRDRRTVFFLIILPILLYPMLMFLVSRLQESSEAEQKAKLSRVAVWGTLPAELKQSLEKSGQFTFSEWTGVPPEVRSKLEQGAFVAPAKNPPLSEAKRSKNQAAPAETEWSRAAQKVLLDRQADAVWIPWPGFESALAGGNAAKSMLLYDGVRPDSRKAEERLNEQLRVYRDTLLRQRETARGLGTGFTEGIEVLSRNVAGASRVAGMMLGIMLPYMLILMSASSGLYAAIDMTAGEKERGTMQTLLCAPVGSLEIIAGKFLAVWGISTLATIVNLLSLALTFTSIKMMPGVTMSVNPVSALLAFLLLLPVTMMISALFVAAGAFAKDFKEGQAYLTPLMMVLIFPLVASMMPGIELNNFLSFVPIMNSALLVRGVFLGEWHAEMLFLTLLSSLCYAVLTLVFAARVYERNALLLGGKESFTSVLDLRRKPGDQPTAGTSLFIFSVALVAAFYGSLALIQRGIPTMLTVVEYGFFLLPGVLFAALKGYDFRATFSIRAPSLRGLAGAVLLGLSGWTLAAGLLVRLFPPPESFARGMRQVLMLDDGQIPGALLFLLIAVSPAVCEELFFRGLVMRGFRGLGMWPAILATAFLFGLAHASIYRLLPTMALGVMMGYAVWRTRSIFAGMAVHVLNNGLVVALGKYKSVSSLLRLSPTDAYLPWSYIAVGAVVMAAGVVLLAGDRDAQSAGRQGR